MDLKAKQCATIPQGSRLEAVTVGRVLDGDDSSAAAQSQRTSLSAPAIMMASNSYGNAALVGSQMVYDERSNNGRQDEAAAASRDDDSEPTGAVSPAGATDLSVGTNVEWQNHLAVTDEEPAPRSAANNNSDANSFSTPSSNNDEVSQQAEQILAARVELTPLPQQQEPILAAQAELTPLPPSPPRHTASSPPVSPTRRQGSASGSMLCGVPVAKPVRADSGPNENDEGTSNDDGQVTNPMLPSHLQHLGPHVVVAAIEEEMEQGQAGVSQTSLISEEDEPIKSNSLCRRRNLLGGVILAALVVAGTVGIVLGTQRDKDEQVNEGTADDAVDENDDLVDNPSPRPTNSPTFPPTRVHSDQHKIILQLLDPFLQGNGFNARPHYHAVEWLEATSFNETGSFDLSPWIDMSEDAVAGPLPLEQEERLVQRYILAVLYFSTGGTLSLTEEEEPSTGWEDGSNFLSDKHECEWSSPKKLNLGVTCDENKRVVEINLTNNSLSGTLPKELRGLTHLRKIDLSDNFNIGGPLPQDLGHLSNLRELLMAHNAFTGTFPSSYGNMTLLKVLDLADNDLVGSIPSEVVQMTDLSNILLSQNHFTDGMNNFCQVDIRRPLFYANCFCKNFPVLEPEVECSCCTICCVGDYPNETCHPNVPCFDG
mmetsp:Transcript_16415/g.35487  ORF Transcript_16415/g.35487 Transcript_16415/m.35487 type:complete len:654 (+) Transcript_16415:85-2046(+)